MKACVLLLLLVLCCNFYTSSAWGRRRRRRRCDASPCQWVWGSCDRACGGGNQSPRITKNKGSCGSCNLPSARRCNTHCCRRNCAWSSWGSWSTCSNTCGPGSQTRSRKHAVTAYCGGSACSGVSLETKSCNLECCPVNCAWGPWSDFGKCSASCGGGHQSRLRNITTEASCSGDSCSGSSKEIRHCNAECCPVDCVWGKWSDFGSCSASCDGGTQTRSRSFKPEATCGGSKCKGPSSESQDCNSQCCPIDCVWDNWEKWSSCSATCGKASRTRKRWKKTVADCGGKACSGGKVEEEACRLSCCPVDCKWSEWSKWSSCDKKCGKGTRTRRRHETQFNECGGNQCKGPRLETDSCFEKCCPVDCEVSKWKPWSDCSKQCGPNGVKTRVRDILIHPSCGGDSCPKLTKERKCNRICYNNGEMTNTGCSCKSGWSGQCCKNALLSNELLNL
ncbi:unnamed protein product [Clavelina lepadiformis]|uniref:Spondin-like TSP1 domain-containing protein n=1 Tax=Clavelina lepadiformis TaxID=159417 RepID=A0ABP0EZR4_CLALP